MAEFLFQSANILRSATAKEPFEQALRNECNYTSYQPYINWSKFSTNLLAAPLFDGSPSSISNNGAYRPHPGITFCATSYNTTLFFPPGLGGSCVTSGPVAGYLPYLTPNPLPSGLGFNPQCLHTAGHYIVGGAPGGDFYTSPGDPYFWLHHAMIDRVWWIWQNQVTDGSREEVVAGTRTMNNRPPSGEATLEDEVELGMLGKGRRLGELVRTTGGPFCYVYV
ncbi:hypothetical protein KVT40_005266 [Elsinoe batatas]|uniref:Tyrosinase copper-binding domain-containing protein n=1 Tax=Elsinoe batatas TaxID=2601811 RepID=A0A8K0KY65_9PEZI|nr:hypothetical protein KVT40_005266 [Elsinoe batatas]